MLENQAAISGLFWSAGLLAGSGAARRAGAGSAFALAVNGGVLLGIQRIASGTYPANALASPLRSPWDDEKGAGFPVSEASTSFAMAAVVSDAYSSRWVDGAAYGLATAAAYSAYARDPARAGGVAAGAAMGWLIGKGVAKSMRLLDRRVEVDAAPDGLSFIFRF